MAEALREHAAHRASPYGCLQGPFVVPARRMRELLAVHGQVEGSLRLSMAVDYADLDASVAEVVAALSAAQPSDVSVAMVELRLPAAELSTTSGAPAKRGVEGDGWVASSRCAECTAARRCTGSSTSWPRRSALKRTR